MGQQLLTAPGEKYFDLGRDEKLRLLAYAYVIKLHELMTVHALDVYFDTVHSVNYNSSERARVKVVQNISQFNQSTTNFQ